ncbi:type II toxin-antitoxin system YoeB family toxin [Geminocystis herdmanii]|nr:type II toxin-antitoxin system YoeB family toxin [Geminocystis herdmanii]
MKISFLDDGWHDYLYWQNQDKKTLRNYVEKAEITTND